MLRLITSATSGTGSTTATRATTATATTDMSRYYIILVLCSLPLQPRDNDIHDANVLSLSACVVAYVIIHCITASGMSICNF